VSLVQRAGGKHVEDIEVLLAVLDRKLRVLAQPLMAAEGIKGNLVSVSWLQQNLNSSDILVVDASPAQLHKAQHIPGAINVDLFSYGSQELPVSEMEQRFQSFGISRGGPALRRAQSGRSA